MNGWTWSEQRDDTARTHPYLVPWSALPEAVKELNRVAIRAIPTELEAVGLVIVRGPSG
jgi:hypothetical protein